MADPDPQWHVPAWSPEQKYLSNVMCGEWSHVSQAYNFEVQLHSGVPLTDYWWKRKVTDVAVVHFSGHIKAWDKEPFEELPLLACQFSRRRHLHHIILHDIISYHIISYHILSYHIISGSLKDIKGISGL